MSKKTLLSIIGLTFGLLCLVAFGVRQYEWNVSALLHMDTAFGERHQVPEGVVLYTDAGYDGMLYYQIARDLPELVTGQETSYDSPYRFQRILLPLFTYIFAVGQEVAFPYTILLLNILSAVGAFALTLFITKKLNVHAFTVALNPAMFVGILYALTEPLSLFFVVVFFVFWERNKRKLDAFSILALILSLLARETTIFLIALLFLWNAWSKQWKETALSVVPIVVLFVWQSFILTRFDSVALGTSSGALSTIPLHGPVYVIQSLFEEFNINRWSSFALLFFVVPLAIHLLNVWLKEKSRIGAYAFFVSGLCVAMLMMDAKSIWGAITSIGRVVTPIYAAYALYASERDTPFLRGLSWTLIIVSIVAAVGIAAVRHPFIIS